MTRLSEQTSCSIPILVGTYTERGSEGIYPLAFDPETGKLSHAGSPANLENPTYLALDAKRNFLFAVSETNNYLGQFGGSLAVYRIRTGSAEAQDSCCAQPETGETPGICISLEKIDQQPVRGKSSCHLLVDDERRLVAVANYGSGSATILAYSESGMITKTADLTGQIIKHAGHGPDSSRQDQAHVHHASLSDQGRQINLVDLGIDQIVSYPWPIDPETASETKPIYRLHCPPARGPRHLVLAKGDSRIYVVTEMGCTVLFFEKNDAGYKLMQEISTIPADFRDVTTCAGIWMSSDGCWLLASNRGHDSLAVYGVSADGRLTLAGISPCGGRTPRDFHILPIAGSRDCWILAASQDDDRICSYRLDGHTGKLGPLVASLPLPAPVCLLPL